MVNYIQNELEALEREQKQIDKQAAFLEKDLRRVMEMGKIKFVDVNLMVMKLYETSRLCQFTAKGQEVYGLLLCMSILSQIRITEKKASIWKVTYMGIERSCSLLLFLFLR